MSNTPKTSKPAKVVEEPIAEEKVTIIESEEEKVYSKEEMKGMIVKIKPETERFLGGVGVPYWARENEVFVSRINPNGTIMIADSNSLIDIDALFMKDVEFTGKYRTFTDETTDSPDISIRIFGVEKRMDYIKTNKERLKLSDEFIVIDKNYEGCIPTAKKAWTIPTDKPYTLVLTDDVELCDNFVTYINKIVKAQPDAIISLFSLHFPKPSSINKKPTISPYIGVDSVAGPGIIMKTEWVKDCIDWWKPEINGDDTNISAWARENNIPMITTIPQTLQHIGEISIFDPTRHLGMCPFYSKNAAGANWDNTYVTNINNILRR